MAWRSGTVEQLTLARGFGFIISEDRSERLFFHFSSVENYREEFVLPGTLVQYTDVEESPKGRRAKSVRATGQPTDLEIYQGTIIQAGQDRHRAVIGPNGLPVVIPHRSLQALGLGKGDTVKFVIMQTAKGVPIAQVRRCAPQNSENPPDNPNRA